MMNISAPYKGLASFLEEDSQRYFGREDEIERGVERLMENKFLAVVGPSGIGKSSLIRAGIIPRLREKHGFEVQPIVFCRFGRSPIDNLAEATAELSRSTNKKDSTALLVIDQFEELYTASDELDRQNTLHELTRIVDDVTVAVIIAIRADFFAQVFESPAIAAHVDKSSLFLGPLSLTSLSRAIIEPAKLAGIVFEEGLLEHILEDVGTDVSTLPLLQILLSNLVSKSDEGVITLSDYHQYGTLRGALEQVLEGIWHSSMVDDQQRIRSIMLRLATISEDGVVTRRSVSLDDFSENENSLVNRLVSERVLSIHHEARNDQTVVEVVHEAIFREWRRFSYWLEEEREFLRLRHRISDATQLWVQSGRASSYLLSGAMLEQAKQLIQEHRTDLGMDEVSFVQQSISASERISSWKGLMGGLGFAKLQREMEQRDERRTEIQGELGNLEEQLRQLEMRKAELASKLEKNKQDVDNMTPKVFLSYASEDFEYVKPIYDQLKKNGFQPWLDRENLLPGVDWDREIVKEIKQSHFVLFCLSSRSINKRGYVQKELRTALSVFDEIPDGQTFLIPVRLEECSVPEALAKYHFADVFREGEFKKLLQSLFKTWGDSMQAGNA